MSRYVKEQGELEIAYGYDHATGYFFQVFGPEIDGEENLLIDECSLFTNMNRGKMLELMKEYKVDQEHQDMVACDLPF